MGDPRKLRNKYERPKKLWDVDRLKEEKGLKAEYGLRSMRELWRSTAELKKFRREARRLLSVTEEERRDDAKKVLAKLAKLGVLKEGSVIDDVLSLEVKSILERRLQTVVLRKGLAKSTAQSRQLITHGFISINGKKVTRPGYVVNLNEEATISYARQIDLSVKAPAEEKPAAEKPAADAAKAPEKAPEKPEAKPESG
jgi:small subunit ribosomal protein S4